MLVPIVSTIVGVCVSMFGWISNLFKSSIPVNTSEQALYIGQKVVHNKFPNINYQKYQINVDDSYLNSSNIWVVSYLLLDEEGQVADVLGGGGPEIHIRKTDGKIVYANLQR